MNTRHTIAIVISSLALSLGAQASFASSSHLVTHGQLSQISRGDSAAHVAQVLGAPADVTSWLDGKHSMDYSISSANDMLKTVYVDLDRNNKVVDVKVLSRE